jgi:hypothetical protein
MRWKLSHLEHVVEVNIVCVVRRLEGSFHVDRLRPALSRVQRKHPALRALIREEPDGLYYEADSAPEIPLRIVPRVNEDDFRRECQTELTTAFAYDQPQLRAVWLQSEGLIPYTANGEMRFHWVIDEKCMSRSQMDTLKREFMAVLQNQARMPGHIFGQEECHEAETETVHH